MLLDDVIFRILLEYRMAHDGSLVPRYLAYKYEQ